MSLELIRTVTHEYNPDDESVLLIKTLKLDRSDFTPVVMISSEEGNK